MPPHLRVFILNQFQNELKNREYAFSHFEAEQINKMADIFQIWYLPAKKSSKKNSFG